MLIWSVGGKKRCAMFQKCHTAAKRHTGFCDAWSLTFEKQQYKTCWIQYTHHSGFMLGREFLLMRLLVYEVCFCFGSVGSDAGLGKKTGSVVEVLDRNRFSLETWLFSGFSDCDYNLMSQFLCQH